MRSFVHTTNHDYMTVIKVTVITWYNTEGDSKILTLNAQKRFKCINVIKTSNAVNENKFIRVYDEQKIIKWCKTE